MKGYTSDEFIEMLKPEHKDLIISLGKEGILNKKQLVQAVADHDYVASSIIKSKIDVLNKVFDLNIAIYDDCFYDAEEVKKLEQEEREHGIILRFDVKKAEEVFDEWAERDETLNGFWSKFCKTEEGKSEYESCLYYPEGNDECDDCPYWNLINDIEDSLKTIFFEVIRKNINKLIIFEGARNE